MTKTTTPRARKPKTTTEAPAPEAAQGAPFDADPPRETAHELVELTPRQQALAAFKPQRDVLSAFRKKFGPDVVVQYETREDGRLTTKGDKAARDDRMELVTARTAIDKRRLALNEDDRQRIKERDEVARQLTNELAPYEEALQTLIKADEKRKEEERLEAERIKREREEAVAAALNGIHNLLISTFGKPAAEIAAAEAELRARELTQEEFGNRYGEAVAAKDHVLLKLAEAHAKALELEERERRAAEAEKRRQEEEAAAEARRQAAEAEERERQARIARENEERAAAIARQEEELAAKRRAFEADQEAARRAAQEREDAERAERQRKEDAERARVQRIRDSIEVCFTRRPAAMADAGSVAIALALAEVQDQPMEAYRFEEFLGEARTAQALAAAELQKLLDLRKQQEAAAEERRKADEAAAAERKRLDDEARAKREREEAEARALLTKQAKEAERARAALARAQQAAPRLLKVCERIVGALDTYGEDMQQANDWAAIEDELRAAVAEAQPSEEAAQA